VNEFELIARFFTRPSRERAGVGDDCALIDAGDATLAITTDMLLAGRHFLPEADPAAVGHKALAVNLSDLAAAGARPRCFFLALALPAADAAWLDAFSRGLLALADRFGCELIGGDTTRAPPPGPLTICITAIGDVPREAVRTRGGALAGDDLWVSGEVGDAALALAAQAGEAALPAAHLAAVRRRLDWPQPRVELGVRLRGLASAAIDVSDGLLGDVGHLVERSGVGALIDWDAVPRSPALRTQPVGRQQDCALAGGDDYELAFTAPPAARAAVLQAAAGCRKPVAVTRIGTMTTTRELVVLDASGAKVETTRHPYDHFAR
jgi:thiamine-monophosphate kinase